MQVSVAGLHVWFGRVHVLRGVDLELAGPASICVLGPSGSGKSTLLGALGGQVVLTQGTVRVLAASGEPREPAWISQTSPLLSRRSAADNVAVGSLAVGADRRRALATAHALLTDLGIASLARQRADRLSGGERQRVAVARAMAARAALVLADESTASLDTHSRETVIDALEVAVARGALVVIATHDQYIAERSDVVVRLVDGQATLR